MLELPQGRQEYNPVEWLGFTIMLTFWLTRGFFTHDYGGL